jgi:hypothetical protein
VTGLRDPPHHSGCHCCRCPQNCYFSLTS